MTSRISKALLAALLLLFGGQTLADDRADSEVVPVTQEPRHRLALEDEHLRLFDVRIPPGDITLYHNHQLDSIYIPISGFENLVNQELGKAGKPLTIKPGSVAFAEHAKVPFTHRVINQGGEAFHVVDIELVAPSKESSAGGVLPLGHQLVLENPRVRISRIVLEPGQFVAGHSMPALQGVTIVLTGTRMRIRGDTGANRLYGVVPGQFFIRAELASREIDNEGDDRLELVTVELK